eukprot:TRINITY_DN23402_c0_g2_i1.p1 TRINITY_DN23402_c0_g2~~TRINITY_DN23402_c0_g2_i1.p1  ORF type:complete len:321 (+),score=44.82 TRINITY_DN23402_c0_g2_i1:72-965(+)
MEVMDNSNGVGGSGAIVVVESAQQKLSSAFMKVYVEWYENFYGKPFQFPVFNKRFFDVEKLWYEVEAHGGSAQVCLSKNWAEIGRKFDPPQYVTNLSTIVKGIYERYLLEYEQRQSPQTAMPTSSTRSTRKRKNPSAPSRSNSHNKQLRLLEGPSHAISPILYDPTIKEELEDDFEGGATTPSDPNSHHAGETVLEAQELQNEIVSQKNKLDMVVAFIDQMKVEQQNKINAVQTYNDMVLQALAKRISDQEEQLQSLKQENQQLQEQIQTALGGNKNEKQNQEEQEDKKEEIGRAHV